MSALLEEAETVCAEYDEWTKSLYDPLDDALDQYEEEERDEINQEDDARREMELRAERIADQ